ncbi:coiled-coil domain-containing protein 63-like [Sander lucioperca]|uniref:Coiled-coil domain-containing protein 63-like n=1 Tax=Sander lucioperca TaxID=283035 RepID=A0A8C9XAY1_SANLU|nr:coiled-coil domain-containing protein 63-like [Sander lucioperca]XP_031132990.1 coiled-coil domain-containing protein 63-like [Sander lucioperca]
MATDILKEQYNNLQEENDQYKRLISQQKDNLVSLDREVTVSESRILEMLTVPGGILKQQGEHGRLRKHIRVLENKLNQDTVKFNELLSNNMDYRKHIAHLLQQKGLWCNIEKKFNRQLATQQNITEKLGERFNLAFSQRSEAEIRMLEMRECIKVETVNFTKRRMQLKTTIAHDAKRQTFMETKFQEIIPLEEDEDSKKRKQQQQYENGVKKMEMYMQGHSTLVQVTGEGDLRHISNMFIQNEQKNFAHISYINELHNRRNTLKTCTDKMKSDILFLEEENKGHDEKIKSLLKDLESELEKYSCLSDSLEKQCAVVQRTLDQLTTAISGLLDKIMQEVVIVNSDNIVHFTSILEESISNILIQANNLEDEYLVPEKMLLANSDLLPENEAVVETEHSRSSTRSIKSA